ncbi:MAG: polymer-forming cytoskeletal protein [Anaerolineae bacterium]
MTRRALWIGTAAVIGVIVVASVIANAARAGQPAVLDTHNVIFTNSYQLDSQTEGDLVVVGSTIDISGTVDGSAALIGDRVTISGVIEGDLAISAPTILLENARINGDVVLMGSHIDLGAVVNGDLLLSSDSLDVREGTTIAGEVGMCASKITDERNLPPAECSGQTIPPIVAALIAIRSQGGAQLPISPLEVLLGGVVFSAMMAGLASLCVTLFPKQISRIEEAIRAYPRHLGGVGVATFALSIGVSAALIVLLALLPPLGVILVPVYLIAGIGLLVLVAVGWVTLSLVIGDSLARRIVRSSSVGRRVYPPLITAALGSAGLSLLFTVLSLIPFGGVLTALLALAILSTGVGAAMFTRLGTRSLTRATFVQG